MAVSAAQIATLRRMVAEPTTTTYSDALLTTMIGEHSVNDARGLSPYEWDYSTDPPTKSTNDSWVETYDLNATAAVIWEEKAAGVACDYNVNADGASLARSSVYEQYMKIAQRYRSKAALGVQEHTSLIRVMDENGDILETTQVFNQYSTDEVFND